MKKKYEAPIMSTACFDTESVVTDSGYINSMQEWKESNTGALTNIKNFSEMVNFTF